MKNLTKISIALVIAIFAIVVVVLLSRPSKAEPAPVMFNTTTVLSAWVDPAAFTGSTSVAQFDPALGTLDSVKFEVNQVDWHFLMQYENEGLGGGSCNATLGQQLETGHVATIGYVTSDSYGSNSSWSVPGWDGTTDYAGLSGRQNPDDASDYAPNTDDYTSTDAGLRSAFTGTGRRAVNWRWTPSSSISVSGNASTNNEISCHFQIAVTYTYH